MQKLACREDQAHKLQYETMMAICMQLRALSCRLFGIQTRLLREEGFQKKMKRLNQNQGKSERDDANFARTLLGNQQYRGSFKRYGWDVVSVDLPNEHQPTHCAEIRGFDYTSLYSAEEIDLYGQALRALSTPL